jgi:hypothetical protein
MKTNGRKLFNDADTSQLFISTMVWCKHTCVVDKIRSKFIEQVRNLVFGFESNRQIYAVQVERTWSLLTVSQGCSLLLPMNC